jgi:hypothetical protein
MKPYTYIIIPSSYLDGYKVSTCIESSLDTVRYSVDDTECVLKWMGSDPGWADGYLTYDHESILLEMAKEEWDDGYV